jgi:hypothetical protein
MDDLIGLLAEAVALSRRASAESKGAVTQAVTRPAPPQKIAAQTGDEKLSATEAGVAPVARPIKALHQDRHPVDLTAAFQDRSSLLTMLVAVEVLGPPPSLRTREHL